MVINTRRATCQRLMKSNLIYAFYNTPHYRLINTVHAQCYIFRFIVVYTFNLAEGSNVRSYTGIFRRECSRQCFCRPFQKQYRQKGARPQWPQKPTSTKSTAERLSAITYIHLRATQTAHSALSRVKPQITVGLKAPSRGGAGRG